MENHAAREEVQQALTTGEGESSRYSQTLLEKTIYVAKRMDDGSVLRICVSHADARGAAAWHAAAGAGAMLLAAVMFQRCFWPAGSPAALSRPLNAIDLDHPLDGEGLR